jgi:hypothetical protein
MVFFVPDQPCHSGTSTCEPVRTPLSMLLRCALDGCKAAEHVLCTRCAAAKRYCNTLRRCWEAQLVQRNSRLKSKRHTAAHELTINHSCLHTKLSTLLCRWLHDCRVQAV